MLEGIVSNYTFLMDYFKEDIILHNLMSLYNDFAYVNYILDLPFDQGYKLYKRCLDTIKEENTEKCKDRIFKLWLVDIRNGYKGDFESYYKKQVVNTETYNMSISEKDSEETRIIKKIENASGKKWKTRRLM
jgi:hypothetical protein